LQVQRTAASTGNKGDHKNKAKHKKTKKTKKQDKTKKQRKYVKPAKKAKRAHVKRPRPLTMVQDVLRVSDKNNNGRLDGDDTVRFRFTLTNTGTVLLENVQIVDRRLKRFKVPIDCEASQLSPGATMICTSGPMRITPFQAKNNKLGRNFAYATATAAGTQVRSKSTVITLVRSVHELRHLPQTGSTVTAGQFAGSGFLLGMGALLVLWSRRRRIS
jgi:LPXTG-motif cell wall-anchored protein